MLKIDSIMRTLLYDQGAEIAKNNSNLVFEKGEEEAFAKFASEYFNGTSELSSVPDLLDVVLLNSINNFDCEKLWNIIGAKKYFYDNMTIFGVILKKVSITSFKNLVNKFENCALAWNYYMVYAAFNKESFDNILDEYMNYVSEKFDTKNCDNKEISKKTGGLFERLMAAYLGMFPMEEDGYKCIKDKSILSEMLKASQKILPSVDLDYMIECHDDKHDFMVPLRIAMPIILSKCVLIDDDMYKDSFKDIIRVFLSLDAGISFEIENVSTNIIELCALIGDSALMKEFISREDIDLCSPEKYFELKREYTCPEDEFGDLKDLITDRVPNINFKHGDLLEFLLNGKVKILNISVIYKAMKYEYLDDIELKNLLDHIQGNDILVYEHIDGNITEIEDVYKRLNKLKENEK